MKKGTGVVALTLISAASQAFAQAYAGQTHLATTHSSSHDRVLSPELRSRIEGILDRAGVVGYSLGIFRAGAEKEEEYAQWGLRTETGAPVTKEVQSPFCHFYNR
jgi:hypothetical protein